MAITTVMPATLVSVPLILVLTLMLAGHWIAVAQAPAPACGNDDMQHQIRTGMYVALDEAFRQQVSALFSVWLKDNRSQPARAKAGIDNAVEAYVHAYRAVDAWSLPPCK